MDDLLITSTINCICFELRVKESLTRIEDKSKISEKQVTVCEEKKHELSPLIFNYWETLTLTDLRYPSINHNVWTRTTTVLVYKMDEINGYIGNSNDNLTKS